MTNYSDKRMREALAAINAYIRGDWDNPCLFLVGSIHPDPRKQIELIMSYYGVSAIHSSLETTK